MESLEDIVGNRADQYARSISPVGDDAAERAVAVREPGHEAVHRITVEDLHGLDIGTDRCPEGSYLREPKRCPCRAVHGDQQVPDTLGSLDLPLVESQPFDAGLTPSYLGAHESMVRSDQPDCEGPSALFATAARCFARCMDPHALRIGLIAPPWVPVPPPVYGGTELVVDHLARGLESAGHQVTLFTTGDSTCPVDRAWRHEHALGTTGDLLGELGHVQAAYERLDDVDVIHDHTLLGPLWSITTGARPVVVTTAHGAFTPELTALYRTVAGRVSVVAISGHHRSTAPTVPIAAVIRHGIDVERLAVGAGDGGYVLFLGRMSPDKGVDRAIRVARAAGKRLVIAAKMWEPAEHRYFTDHVAPLLGPDAEYIGEVGGERKAQLLAGAEALVNPIRWPEPFGLVMIEALAVGTPVLTFAEGSAPEIVEHGRIGFLCTDEDDMVRRLRAIGEIDRRRCREAAEKRFSTGRMIDDHLSLYRGLISERSEVFVAAGAAHVPRTRAPSHPPLTTRRLSWP